MRRLPGGDETNPVVLGFGPLLPVARGIGRGDDEFRPGDLLTHEHDRRADDRLAASVAERALTGKKDACHGDGSSEVRISTGRFRAEKHTFSVSAGEPKAIIMITLWWGLRTGAARRSARSAAGPRLQLRQQVLRPRECSASTRDIANMPPSIQCWKRSPSVSKARRSAVTTNRPGTCLPKPALPSCKASNRSIVSRPPAW